MARKDDRFFMSSVKLGPKGQIVIPKEAREMFGLEPGDNLILKRGIALQTVETMNPMMRKAFSNMTPEEVSE